MSGSLSGAVALAGRQQPSQSASDSKESNQSTYPTGSTTLVPLAIFFIGIFLICLGTTSNDNNSDSRANSTLATAFGVLMIMFALFLALFLTWKKQAGQIQTTLPSHTHRSIVPTKLDTVLSHTTGTTSNKGADADTNSTAGESTSLLNRRGGPQAG